MTDMAQRYGDQTQAFGAWLLAQQNHPKWIKDLAKMASADRRFPRNGTVEEVRKHLEAQGADGEMFERLDDAELDYLAI